MSTRPMMTAAELRTHQVDAYGRDYSESDDGYSDMDAERKRGWAVQPCWGEDGWDLGDWPYVTIYTQVIDGADSLRYKTTDNYALLSICEGDRTRYHFKTREDLDAALDYLFLWYIAGRGYPEFVAAGITAKTREALDNGTLSVPDRFRGPYRTKAVAS